jgi:hypothetical protein
MFSDKLFDIEHALNIYAHGSICLPAAQIYNEAFWAANMELLQTCHIYLIGLLPKVVELDASEQNGGICVTYEVAGENVRLQWPIPQGGEFVSRGADWCCKMPDGKMIAPSTEMVTTRLKSESGCYNFEVLYIGQAYGTAGSRNALDRLLKHETLQKIALGGIPEGRMLQLLLLGIQANNRVITVTNPRARNDEQGPERIRKGVEKPYNTSDVERVSLFEASLIRYFKPHFNTEFKNSFPSTNMKILADCYHKDFSAIIAEICMEELPFMIYSAAVPPKNDHIITYDLHEDISRRVFFSQEV